MVLVPGLGAGDASMAPLRQFLQGLGHDARPAGLGRIHDDVAQLSRRLHDLVTRVRAETGRPVALVGWSLGGVLSREVARHEPSSVRRVITFGTPVVGGPAYSALAWRYHPDDLAAIRAVVDARNQVGIRVPVTAIWSRWDGIVSPQACIDRLTPQVEHVEVTSTHLGMGLDPDVWSAIAARLAAGR